VSVQVEMDNDMETKATREHVEQALAEIRITLNAVGRDVEMVGIEDGVVQLRLKGACGGDVNIENCEGCPMSLLTVKEDVQRAIIKAVPDVKEVVLV